MGIIEEEIEKLPEGKMVFLLSLTSPTKARKIAKYLKEKRPLCVLMIVHHFATISEYTKHKDDLKYKYRVDNNAMIINQLPETFIQSDMPTKFTRIFVDKEYSDLNCKLAKGGRIIKI